MQKQKASNNLVKGEEYSETEIYREATLRWFCVLVFFFNIRNNELFISGKLKREWENPWPPSLSLESSWEHICIQGMGSGKKVLRT